jgi:large subunit ribosomal protein L17
VRHQKTRHKLSRSASHRKALLANLCKEVIQHERIRTTEAKAKAVKPEVEQLITLAKQGDLHARRQALSALGQDKFTVHKLFEEVAPRYAERPGRLHPHPQARSAPLGRDRDGVPRAGLSGVRQADGP